ncbi:MAG: ABC transporter permease [Kiritimatiellae bacterium]|nr:ABC transporter permease [Kiritimatiellia bacterium]
MNAESSDQTGGGPHPVAVYEPYGLQRLGVRLWARMFADLGTYRGLLARLFLRDLTARYRRSWLGYVWAVLPQLVVVFAFWTLSSLRGLEALRRTPYHYVAYALWGMGVWQLFAGCYRAGADALSAGGALVTKINFPKEMLVFAAMGQPLFDFLIRLVPVVIVFARLRIVPCWTALLLPLAILPVVLLAAGLAMIMAIVNTIARDLGDLFGMALGFGVAAAPVLYGPPQQWPLALVNIVNPVSPVLIASHDLILSGTLSSPATYAMAWLFAVLVFGVGWRFFRLAMPRVAERF